jgi:hypothetical protein
MVIHVIRKVAPAQGLTLNLWFDEEPNPVPMDFAPKAARGGVFAPLSDPSHFARFSIGERGRFLAWPDDLEFCADALWLEAHGKGEEAA